jgi:hypothetical protein
MAHSRLANGTNFIQIWSIAAGYADCDKELFSPLECREFDLRDYYPVKEKSIPAVT